jgi:hypothetical protein
MRCGNRTHIAMLVHLSMAIAAPVLVGMVLAIAGPGPAQAEDLFQSAPGPDVPKPKPHAQTPRPPAADLVAPAPPAVVPPLAAEQVYSRYVPSGMAGRVADKVNWDINTCAANTVDIRIVEQPRSGTAAIRDEMLTIPAKRGTIPPTDTLAACIGRPVLGKGVYYQSNPGFRGTDRLAFLHRDSGGVWHRFEVQITVE